MTLYFLVRALASALFRLGTSISLLEEQPGLSCFEGPALLAINHISHFDPPLISVVMKRPLKWIAMKELFAARWSSAFFKKLGCLPVHREGTDVRSNRSLLRGALNAFQQGKIVAVFPEGGIRHGKESLLEGAPLKSGLLTMSLLGQVPVIPCVLLGSDRLYRFSWWLRRKKIWVILGKPLYPPSQKGEQRDLSSEQTITTLAEAKRCFQKELQEAFPRLEKKLSHYFGISPKELPDQPKLGW